MIPRINWKALVYAVGIPSLIATAIFLFIIWPPIILAYLFILLGVFVYKEVDDNDRIRR